MKLFPQSTLCMQQCHFVGSTDGCKVEEDIRNGPPTSESLKKGLYSVGVGYSGEGLAQSEMENTYGHSLRWSSSTMKGAGESW